MAPGAITATTGFIAPVSAWPWLDGRILPPSIACRQGASIAISSRREKLRQGVAPIALSRCGDEIVLARAGDCYSLRLHIQAMRKNRKRLMPDRAKKPATSSRWRAACSRTKACSMPSVTSACAIPAIPADFCCRARARRNWSSRRTCSSTRSTPSRCAPPNAAAVRGARHPRLHLSGAPRCHGGVPSSRGRRCCRSALRACRSFRSSISAPPSAQTMPFWDQRDEFGDTNLLVVKARGGPFARPRARVARGGADEPSRRDRGRRDLRELVSRSIFMCQNAVYQLQAHMLGKVVPLTLRRDQAGGLASTRCPTWWAGPGNTGRMRLDRGRAPAAAPRGAQAAKSAVPSAARGNRRQRAAADRGRSGRANATWTALARRGRSHMIRESQLEDGHATIGASHSRRNRSSVADAGPARRGPAQGRDRADQQLGKPDADARPGRRHLQEARI